MSVLALCTHSTVNHTIPYHYKPKEKNIEKERRKKNIKGYRTNTTIYGTDTISGLNPTTPLAYEKKKKRRKRKRNAIPSKLCKSLFYHITQHTGIQTLFSQLES